MTILVAAAVFAACAGLRHALDRPGRADRTFCGGRIHLTALWNEGAAFGLPMGRRFVAGVSLALLPIVWLVRRRTALGAGLALGGGLSNLWERLRHGRVYDYLRFPGLPKLGRYVWNLADFAIVLGGALLAVCEGKR